MAQPFVWGMGGQKITTPEQAKRQRSVAEALMTRAPSENWQQGLAGVLGALSGTVLQGRADEAEAAGRERAGGLFADLALNSDPNSIIAALTSPDAAWASDAQTSIASALLNQGLERSDPMYQLQLQQAQLELENLRNPTPDNPYLNVGGGSIFDTSSGQFITAPNVGDTSLPNDVQEYNWYAENEVAAGREPLPYLDFVNAQKGSGLSVTTNPDGTTTVTQGGPGKLTEAQGKDVVYYTRGLDANTMLANLDTELTDFGQEHAGKAPLGIGNYFRDPAFRQAKIAADAFLTAVLRKDTGAAITDQEFEIYGPIFLPVPGDDPATIQTKKRMRDVALLAIKGGLGTADAVAQANAAILGANANAPIAPVGTVASPTGGYRVIGVEN